MKFSTSALFESAEGKKKCFLISLRKVLSVQVEWSFIHEVAELCGFVAFALGGNNYRNFNVELQKKNKYINKNQTLIFDS